MPRSSHSAIATPVSIPSPATTHGNTTASPGSSDGSEAARVDATHAAPREATRDPAMQPTQMRTRSPAGDGAPERSDGACPPGRSNGAGSPSGSEGAYPPGRSNGAGSPGWPDVTGRRAEGSGLRGVVMDAVGSMSHRGGRADLRPERARNRALHRPALQPLVDFQPGGLDSHVECGACSGGNSRCSIPQDICPPG